MKNLLIGLSLLAACFQFAAGQKLGADARSEAREEIKLAKKQAIAVAAATPQPSDFNDTDSFGKNAIFLGSLYAGTVYFYYSCDPAVLSADFGITLAADDHCIVKNTPGTNPVTTVSDPAWQITIPGKTVSNVIYPMLNNNVGWENHGITSGAADYFYSPRVTIVSDALNDPAAIDPTTGLPMNGSFTTSLQGAEVKSFVIGTGEAPSSFTSYASISGRGLSRAYFRALGLPDTVINNLFKKDMTLKFAMRVRVAGAIDFGQFFYTFRLIGN